MRNHNMWPEVREGENVVGFWTPYNELKGGDLIGLRFGVYASGRNQVLVVACIDGYGGDIPLVWKAYSLPELECQPVSFEDLTDPNSYRVVVNTFSDVRNTGDMVPEDDARALFPQLDELPYGR